MFVVREPYSGESKCPPHSCAVDRGRKGIRRYDLLTVLQPHDAAPDTPWGTFPFASEIPL